MSTTHNTTSIRITGTEGGDGSPPSGLQGVCAPLYTMIVPAVLTAVAIASLGYAQGDMLNVSERRQQELIYMVRHDCGSCHGMALDGGLGPALTPKRLAAIPDAALMQWITSGNPEKGMPAWGGILESEEIRFIVHWLKHHEPSTTGHRVP